jgi:hypothetical protein
MSKEDPWGLNLKAGKEQKAALKGGGRSIGVPCPKKNWNKPCHVCEKAARLFATGNEADEKLARSIYVKKQPFCNVELLNDRGKVYLMALPVSAATAFFEGVYETGAWGNPCHPAPTKDDIAAGLPLVLSKRKEDGYTKYTLSPKMAAQPPERRISSKVILEQRYSFSTLVQDIEAGKVENIYLPKADLSEGSKVEFKILPNPEDPSASPIFIGYYHYNVTKDDVNGTASARNAATDVEDDLSDFTPAAAAKKRQEVEEDPLGGADDLDLDADLLD